MKAMLTTWLGPNGHAAGPEHLSVVTALPASGGPVDGQALDSLRQLQREGRPHIVQQVIRLFFKGAAGLLKDLEHGAATGDYELLYRASHALKSASANVGAVLLSSRCKELEALARSGILRDAVRIVKAIREDYGAVEADLSERLPRVA